MLGLVMGAPVELAGEDEGDEETPKLEGPVGEYGKGDAG